MWIGCTQLWLAFWVLGPTHDIFSPSPSKWGKSSFFELGKLSDVGRFLSRHLASVLVFYSGKFSPLNRRLSVALLVIGSSGSLQWLVLGSTVFYCCQEACIVSVFSHSLYYVTVALIYTSSYCLLTERLLFLIIFFFEWEGKVFCPCLQTEI